MQHETQNIEFKQSWHDEYLKWICGFANAQGGKLVIGVDDEGNAVGVADWRLLSDSGRGGRMTMFKTIAIPSSIPTTTQSVNF